jgi:polysaccharide export outer membrane protein
MFHFKRTSTVLLLIVAILMSTACSSKRNLVYFSDLPQTQIDQTKDLSAVLSSSEPKIQQNDVVGITVTSLSPESNNLFNMNYGSNVVNTNTNSSSITDLSVPKVGYRVDQDGNIGFPVLGQVKLAGLTTDEAQTYLVKQLSGYLKSPLVSVNFLNFKITVIGEVNRPGTFNVNANSINLLEALGLAGDMTAYGKRENVLLIRQIDNKRTMVRINLNDSRVFDTPYYYLHQNDIVYVEPDKSKSQITDADNRFIPIIAASASIVAVLLNIWLIDRK